MEITVKTGDILKTRADAAVLTACEGAAPAGLLRQADRELGGLITRAAETGEFTGKLDQTIVFRFGKEGEGPVRLMLVGLGKKERFRPDGLVRAAALAARALEGLGLKEITCAPQAAKGISAAEAAGHFAQGAVMGLYSFDRFKTPEPDKKALAGMTLVYPDAAKAAAARKHAASGQAIGQSVCFARDMINSPANEMTPSIMAAQAKEMAKEFGLKFKALGREQCEKLGMGAFLGVAAGSAQPPSFIILEYNGSRKKGEKPTVLVGKAITFDSGGISIKPVQGMEKMKYDMAGGAVVIGAMRAAAALKLPVNLVGLVPASENLPSGSAYKPGDVMRAMNGKTIEIISTDAEGRMVLADALCYAGRHEPKAVIDVATLTGGCVIALGDQAIGLMGNDARLIDALRRAGEKTAERAWELPMWEEYLEPMKGEVTDLKNAGGREAQTITAGKFLEQFVGEYPWAHLDIAGTAWEEKGRPHYPKGGCGIGVRLLVEYLSGGGR